MNKALIILRREYITRVRKKSFVIMTLLVPFLFAAFTVLPAWLAMQDDTERRTIAVSDESGLFTGKFENTEYTSFHFVPATEAETIKKDIGAGPFYALLLIPADIIESNQAEVYSERQLTMDVKNMIEDKLGKTLEAQKKKKIIDQAGIPDLEQKLASARTNIKLQTIKVSEEGTTLQSSTEIAMGAGYVAGFIIYMFVFIYGTMVMRGVMEEKTNRIVEVIISSVKPAELMFGKIVGIGLVGLTQLLFWVIILTGIMTGIQAFAGPADTLQQSQLMAGAAKGNMVLDIANMISNLNLPLILGCFLFYFIGGFLLYSSLMGAVGAAVDSEEEVQQFMLPVTIPLIFSIIILFPIIKNPEGPLAFWASVIPFTSPVIMMARIPFDVPVWELILSMVVLILSIGAVIWVAGKIYRTGILIYGKKVNLKEILKWISYKN